jgi:flagellin
MSSILTNTSALVALQTLKSINSGMGKVQNEVSTGLKVSTAKENSSTWSIASTMNSDVSSFKKLGEALTSASAMVGVARTAAEEVAEIVKQIQTKFVQAENPDADLTKIGAEVTALTATITSIAASAQYNGINLVNTGSTAETVTVSVIRSAAGALSCVCLRRRNSCNFSPLLAGHTWLDARHDPCCASAWFGCERGTSNRRLQT